MSEIYRAFGIFLVSNFGGPDSYLLLRLLGLILLSSRLFLQGLLKLTRNLKKPSLSSGISLNFWTLLRLPDQPAQHNFFDFPNVLFICKLESGQSPKTPRSDPLRKRFQRSRRLTPPFFHPEPLSRFLSLSLSLTPEKGADRWSPLHSVHLKDERSWKRPSTFSWTSKSRLFFIPSPPWVSGLRSAVGQTCGL